MKGLTPILGYVLMSYSFFVFSQKNSGRSGLSLDFFGDYYYNIARDTLFSALGNNVLLGDKGMHGFIIRRLDVGYMHHVSPTEAFAFKVSTEESDVLSNGKRAFVVKQAFFVRDSMFKRDISFFSGIIPNPTVFYAEKWTNHRFLEKNITVLRLNELTNDLGVALKANLGKSFFAHVMVGSNSGSKLETDKYKSLIGVLGFQSNERWLITLEGTYHQQQKVIDVYDLKIPPRKLSNDRWLISLFAGTQFSRVRLGVNFFIQQRQHDFNNGRALVTYYQHGASWYSYYAFSSSHAFFGRIDFYDPNLLLKENARWYGILAYEYKIREEVLVSPNVQVEYYVPVHGKKFSPSITGRLTLRIAFDSK